MYPFFATLIGAAVLFLSATPSFFKKKVYLTAALAADILLLTAGVACLIAAHIRLTAIFANTSLSDSFRAWAADAYTLWVRTAGIFTAGIGGAILLAALIRHKMVRTRAAVGAAASAVVLIFGALYAVTVENASADLCTPIYLFSLGCACLLPLGTYADTALARFAKKKDKK